MSSIKATLRKELRAEAARHTSAERERGSKAICKLIRQQEIWRKAKAVLTFMPLEGEPDISTLLRAGLDAGQRVALPRFDRAANGYSAALVTDPARQLLPGKYGVLEPGPDCPVLSLNELDLALVPGIGFTLNGCRLGRGKGYFDRILCEVRGWKCGVAFDWQVTVAIPSEQHDIHVNSIVTPTRWHVAAS